MSDEQNFPGDESVEQALRVGLEDSLWDGPGRLAASNAVQVSRARQILEGLGLEIATPAEAREILALKGGDQVGF